MWSFVVSMFLLRMSSTSVEQARERSYHRALLLSKDKDTGEMTNGRIIISCFYTSVLLKLSGDVFLDGEAEGGDTPALRDCPSPGLQKTPTHAVSQQHCFVCVVLG